MLNPKDQETLEILRFELKFLEVGGYGRSRIPRGVRRLFSRTRRPA